MNPHGDADVLQSYLDGMLSTEEALAIEARLKVEPLLAEALVSLAREEVVLTEWARVAARTSRFAPLATKAERPSVGYRWWPATIAGLLLVALGVTSWWRSREPVKALPLARLEQVTGQVFFTTADRRDRAAAGQDLVSGQGLEVLGEESFAVIAYADGTRLELGGDATIKELSGDHATGKRVVLAEGNLRADVARQPPGLPMVLITPSAEVLVLGTKFELSGSVDATSVETAEGSVRLTLTSEGRWVEVPAGFEGIAAANSLLDARPSAPRIREPRFTAAGHHRTTVLSRDGRTLVTSRFPSGSVTLWDVASGRERISLAAHDQRVIAAAFSPDSLRLATGSVDRSIKVWDVETGQLLIELDGPVELQALTYSSEGAELHALAGPPQQAKTLTSWKLGAGERRTDPQTYPGEVWAFSPAGRLLATASARTSSVSVWDAATGTRRTVLRQFPLRVLALAFSPDESRLAVSDRSGRVTLWSIPAGELQSTFLPAGQTVQGLAFSADGKLLAMGQRHATVRLWEVATGEQQAILEGPRNPGSTATVRPMFFSPDGKTLATTESLDDSTVRLWDLPVK